MKKYSRNIKGIALIWAILLTLVIMIISSTIASYTIKESRMTINISDSTQAYSDAKSGTEWAYFYLKSIPSPLLTPASYTLDFGTTGTAAITITPDLPTTGDYTIDSTGQYGGIERKIEQVVNPSVGASVAFGSNAFTPSTSTSGSFEFGFTFTPVTAGSNSFNLTNGSGTSVGIQKSGSNWNLLINGVATQINTVAGGVTPMTLGTGIYRARIKYLNGRNVSIKITDTADESCLGFVTASTGATLSGMSLVTPSTWTTGGSGVNTGLQYIDVGSFYVISASLKNL